MPDFAKRYRDMLGAMADTQGHDWRLYALESHCVDCELKLRDHIATLEAEVARLEGFLEIEREMCRIERKKLDHHFNRAKAAEQRAERYKVALERVEKMPWPDSESPYAVIARAALEETQ